MTHTSTEQPEALRLAELIETGNRRSGDSAIAAELRRLHARVQELEAKIETGKRLLREEMDRANRYAEASQAQRVPLPLSEILHFAGEHGFVNIQGDRAFCAFVDGTDVAFELEALARDIERAHGIGKDKA